MDETNRMDWKLKRISNGLKQKNIAKCLGVSAALICQYENCKSDMSSHLIEQYENIINNQE